MSHKKIHSSLERWTFIAIPARQWIRSLPVSCSSTVKDDHRLPPADSAALGEISRIARYSPFSLHQCRCLMTYTGERTIMQKASGISNELPRLDPARFLSRSPPVKHEDHGTALIILNSHLANFECFRRLYSHADFIVCADAGANRLFDLVTEQYSDLAYDVALRKYLPQYIHGDLDSITPKVQQAYASLGVKVTKDSDQYSTDFQKAVKKVFEVDSQARDILVLGSLGGRVDQGIGLIHELYREHKRRVDTRIWFFSESSVSVVLEQGRTALATPLSQGIFRKHVGILPVYGPAVISTKGFEWDVEDWHTEMGGIVSTSNHIVQDVVEIRSDREVLFTVELAEALSGN